MEDEMMDFENEMYDEDVQSQIKDNLARKNYDVVSSRDINFSDYYGKENQVEIEKTLNDMIEHFTEIEEYEKCAIILKELKKVQGKIIAV
jgi:hypothetical protein